MVTRRETLNKIAEAISELYGEVEARQIAEMVVTECGGISRNELLVEPNKELIINDIERIIEELRQWRPVQYVTGRAEFDGLEFEVAEDFEFVGIPLKDIKWKNNLLVAAVIREGNVIYAHGSTTLELGDRIIITTTNTKLYDLGDALA